jgi:hypothetical protein
MRSLLLVILLASRAHADQVMYEISMTDTTVQDLVDGKPTGKARPAQIAINGTSGCHFDVAPKGVYHPWFDGTIDDGRRFHRSHNEGGANAEVVDCAHGVVINASFAAPAGSYRLSGTVTFKKILYHVQ